MMQAAHFIIAILGCGEGEAPCQPVRTLEPRYASQAACSAATEAVLQRNSDADFPVVVAQCVRAGAAPERLVPGAVERPRPPALRPGRLPSSPVRN
jgi:ABC-type hemin transport system ATPase subunit